MFGERLKAVVDNSGMTQSEIAFRAGISKQYMSDLLRKKSGSRVGAKVCEGLRRVLKLPKNFFTDIP